jgi:hypothetical protein
MIEGHVGGTDSFRYIWERSLCGPRDVLNFVRRAINTAVNRAHTKVTEEDLLKAEEEYSQDVFQGLYYELRDVFPLYNKALHGFTGMSDRIEAEMLPLVLSESGISDEHIQEITNVLLWFGFLGVVDRGGKQTFSHDCGYDLEQLRKAGLDRGGQRDQSLTYCVHPGFRRALGIAT